RPGAECGTVIGSLFGFGDQAPHLSAGDGPATVKGCLGEGLTLAEGVAVALVVVGGNGCGKKVSLDITAQFNVPQISLSQHRDPRLTARSKEFCGVALRGSGHFQR